MLVRWAKLFQIDVLQQTIKTSKAIQIILCLKLHFIPHMESYFYMDHAARKAYETLCPNLETESQKYKRRDFWEKESHIWVLFCEEHGYVLMFFFVKSSKRKHNNLFGHQNGIMSSDIHVIHVIYQTRETVFHRDIQTPRRELKIRRAAEYFWRNSRCLDIRWNTVSSVWYIFSNETKTKE